MSQLLLQVLIYKGDWGILPTATTPVNSSAELCSIKLIKHFVITQKMQLLII